MSRITTIENVTIEKVRVAPRITINWNPMDDTATQTVQASAQFWTPGRTP